MVAKVTSEDGPADGVLASLGIDLADALRLTTSQRAMIAARITGERPSSARATPEWVYFVQSGWDGPIKIGCAADVDARVRQLQTGSADQLWLLAAMHGDAATEHRLHELFSGYRVRGEWFSPAPVLLDFIGAIS